VATKERVLGLSLDQTVDMFSARKWTFFNVDSCRSIVKVEARISDGESWVVELPYEKEEESKRIINTLINHGFIQQTIRFVAE